MTVDTTNAGGLIQEQVAAMLVQPLEAASVILAAGPTLFNSSAPLRVNTLGEISGIGFVGENEQIPDGGAAAFGEIQLMPTNRKSLKRIIRVSNELIRQATVGVSEVLQQRIVLDMRNALDEALLNGDGADQSITGLTNQAGVTRVSADLTDPDTFLDALALLASREVAANRLILNGGDFFNLRKIKDQNGRYMIQETMQEDVQYRLFGVPVSVTNKIAAGTAIAADMSSVAVVRDVDPTVTILTERYAEYDQVGIRVVTRYDLGLIRPDGVVIIETPAP